MGIEPAVAAYLGDLIEDAVVSVIVPNPRPGRLVTVERTGGGVSNQLDHPTVAVQSWAPTFMDAEALSREVDRHMREAPLEVPGVSGVEASTIQRWPDPDSGSPRYQGIYTLTTTI